MAKKIDVSEIEGNGINFVKTLLINFNNRYQKRILRYYIRSLRKLRRRLR